MQTTKIELQLRDVCCPDYLQDHRGETIAIPFCYPCDVDDIQDQLVSELKARFDLKSVDMLSVADSAMDILEEFAHIWNSPSDLDEEGKEEAYNEIMAYVVLDH